MLLTQRQEKIIEMVRVAGPMTGEHIAERLGVSRAALRPDLAILIMSGILDARPKVGYYFTGKTAVSMIAEEIGRILVRDIQSVPVVVLPSVTAFDTIVTMFLEDVGTVFVVEPGGFLQGVVSRKDLLKVSMSSRDMQKTPVKVMMTSLSKVIVTFPEESALVAAKKLIEHEVDSLPVVRYVEGADNKSYEVVGRLTKTNITRMFTELGTGKRR